jgi:hypothetical protein
LYDLVINLEHLPREAAVELIVNEAARLRERKDASEPWRMSAQRQSYIYQHKEQRHEA